MAASKTVSTLATQRQLGGSTTVALLNRCAPWERWPNFVGVVGERAQGFWSEARGGGAGEVSMPMVVIGSLRLWRHNDVGL